MSNTTIPKVLVIVVSCEKNKYIWPILLERQIENLVIICGGAEEDKLEGQMLYLKCSDLYDGLCEKMISAFTFISNSDKFREYTHFLKADDHDTYLNKIVITNIPISFRDILHTHDYIGQEILTNDFSKDGSTWHFGKVHKESIWYNKRCYQYSTPYASGGGTYILSRHALLLISMNRDSNQLYEDSMIGSILIKYNISPYKCVYGIPYWQG